MLYNRVFNSTKITGEQINIIKSMPKIETHVHLEGATQAELIFHLAARNNVSLPSTDLADWKKYCEFTDFNHFIEIYILAVSCMQTPQDFVEMVMNFMKCQSQQNIQYTEAYISPALHFGKMPNEELIASLAEGIKQGAEKFDTTLSFIPDISREMCVEKSIQFEVLEFALEARDAGIAVGLGIGGKEIGFPPEFFAEVFAEAHRQKLHVVAHAGETGGPDSIWGAINDINAERIGHGIDALKDNSLLELLRERQIPLEVSPQSNYCTKIVKSTEPHPIRRMVDAGLYCTLNSDDPPMFSTDLTNEYLTLATQGFSMEELWELNLNGLRSSFLPHDQKLIFEKLWEGSRTS
jgi:adenosine deaminase